MDDAERAFRDALHRVDSVKIPVPSLEPVEVRRTRSRGRILGRWVAAAAAIAVVAGLGTWALTVRGQPVTALPAAPASADARAMLTGATWVALDFYGKPAASANGAVPYLRFEADSTFTGGDLCDQVSSPIQIETDEVLGTYRQVGNDLTIALDPTKAIGCDATEQQLVRKVLDDTRRVYRNGDTLELLDQPGSVLARFRATAGHQQSGPTPTPPVATDPPTPHPAPPTTSTATANQPTAPPTPISHPAPAIWIRIRNASTVDFSDVYAVFPSGAKVHYGRVPAGSVSRYEMVQKAYRYTYLKVTTAGKSYVQQPIDYVGESELPDGHYAYVLDLVGSRIDQTLEQD